MCSTPAGGVYIYIYTCICDLPRLGKDPYGQSELGGQRDRTSYKESFLLVSGNRIWLHRKPTTVYFPVSIRFSCQNVFGLIWSSLALLSQSGSFLISRGWLVRRRVMSGEPTKDGSGWLEWARRGESKSRCCFLSLLMLITVLCCGIDSSGWTGSEDITDSYLRRRMNAVQGGGDLGDACWLKWRQDQYCWLVDDPTRTAFSYGPWKLLALNIAGTLFSFCARGPRFIRFFITFPEDSTPVPSTLFSEIKRFFIVSVASRSWR